jgi:hypothetical protein
MNYTIKTILFLLVTVVTMGCSSDSSNSTTSDYLEISINGKSYKEDFFHSGSGFSGQTGCVSKSHFLAYLDDIENSNFTFGSEILHLENEIDFKNSVVGNYKAVRSSSTTACNLDLKLSFLDKTQNVQTTQIQSGGINTITSISRGNSIATETEYKIKGNFISSFKNNSNVIIPITGKYQITIVVLK